MAVGREEIIDYFDFVVGKIFETLNSTGFFASEVFVLVEVTLRSEPLDEVMSDFSLGRVFKVVKYCPDDAHAVSAFIILV